MAILQLTGKQFGLVSVCIKQKLEQWTTTIKIDIIYSHSLYTKTMRPQMLEPEIIHILTDPFDSLLQDALSVQRITTSQYFKQLLKREGILVPSRVARGHNTSRNSEPPPHKGTQYEPKPVRPRRPSTI